MFNPNQWLKENEKENARKWYNFQVKNGIQSPFNVTAEDVKEYEKH